MLDKEKLRKADAFSGVVFFLFGLWVVFQAFKMPMKDSFGGVMNVWYVSPALMPLFIGFIIMILGIMLCRIALKTIGFASFKETFKKILGPATIETLGSDETFRFYAIAILFISLVYVNIPRIDFFLCAVFFLTSFIMMFFFTDDFLMRKFMFFYVACEAILLAFFILGLHASTKEVIPYLSDIISIILILSFIVFVWKHVRLQSDLKKKFRIGMIISLATPFVIGPIFKYFLMVPLPKEGLIVRALDYLWYLEFME